MKRFPDNTALQTQGGFTLLELLLVIGIAAVLFLGISQITTGWVDSEVSDGAGQHLQRVSTVVQNYVEANWNNDTTPLSPTADALNDPNWSALKTALDQEGLLSNGDLRTPLNAPLKIGFVKDIIAGNTIYRTTIYATKTLPYKRVIETARQTGNTGGIINSFPDGTNAFGAFGQWKVPTANLLPGGVAPCIPDKGSACLLAVISYNQQTLCGPFLYREDVEAVCPGGNTMATDLNMGNNPAFPGQGYDIVNAGGVTADNLTVKNDATLGTMNVAGNSTLSGPVTASGGLAVNAPGGGGPAMTVSGNANFSGDVGMNGGNLNVTNLNANSVQASEVQTNEMHAQNLTMTNGTLAVDNDVSINGNLQVNGTNAEILASTVNAGVIDANGGSVTVGTMNVNNTMQINGQVNVTGTTISADRLVSGKCIQIDQPTTKKYGNCP